MTKHLGYSIIGGLLFLITTVIVLWFFGPGVHDSFGDAISNSTITQSAIRASFWIGVFAGGVTSVVLRKSVNRKVYVWIALIFTLILTQVVLATVV